MCTISCGSSSPLRNAVVMVHQLTMSPRQSIASPTDPPTFLRRKVASHSTGPSTFHSQQSVESPSPPHGGSASLRHHR
ncbi:hypothetical protein Tco_0352577 [Tanacetum coccineum]